MGLSPQHQAAAAQLLCAFPGAFPPHMMLGANFGHAGMLGQKLAAASMPPAPFIKVLACLPKGNCFY